MLPELRRCYPIAHLGVFGSWARGEQREGSDLDLLVDFDGPIDLFAYARLQEEIASALGMRSTSSIAPGSSLRSAATCCARCGRCEPGLPRLFGRHGGARPRCRPLR